MAKPELKTVVTPVEELPYEEARILFDDDVKKNADSFTVVAHYVDTVMQTSLNQHSPAYEIIDREEALRVAFFVEDKNESRDENNKIDHGAWLHENYERNPDFFSKYFRRVMEGEIMRPEISVDPALEIIHGSAPEQIEDAVLVTDENKETVEQPQEEQPEEKQPEPVIDIEAGIAATVDELRKRRTEELQQQLTEIVSKALRINLVDKSDILAALAENKVLKELTVNIFGYLGIEVNTTSVSNNSVSSRVENFKSVETISLEDIRKGAIQAKVQIGAIKAKEAEFANADRIKKELEGKVKTLSAELSRAVDHSKRLENDLMKENKKPKIEQAKPFLHYIAWEEEGKRYYLGTTAEDVNSAGVYVTASLIKTRKKSKAIEFSDRELALLQVDKAIRFYNKINRKALISLEHLKQCFIVSHIEYEDKSRHVKTIVRES